MLGKLRRAVSDQAKRDADDDIEGGNSHRDILVFFVEYGAQRAP